MTPEPHKRIWSRCRRIQSALRIVFFALLPALPVIAYCKDFDLQVVITCLLIYFFAGILLRSALIIFMLLGTFGGLIVAEPGPHDSGWAAGVIVCTLFGSALGIAFEVSIAGERKNRVINWRVVAELFLVIILLCACFGLCLLPIRT